MPIFTDDDVPVPSPEALVPEPVIETASVYQNINTRVKVIPHIEGNSLTVDYFGRVIGDSDPASLPTDLNNLGSIQYQLIKGLELRVTDELTQNTDEQTQTTTVVGSANMYPIVIPIIGDTFISPLGDGTYATFVITATERISIFKETAWKIEYTLDSYATEEVIAALLERVVTTLYFDLKGLNESGGALATESEYNRKVTRKTMLGDLIDRFYAEYYNPIIKTFMVPDPLFKLYDPYLVDFWNYLVGKELSGGKLLPHQFDVRGAIFKTDYTTVWDAVIKQNRGLLNRSVMVMHELATTAFIIQYVQFTLHSSGIDRVVHPVEVGGLAITGLDAEGSNYIFSDAFYTKAEVGQTPLEILVNKVIDGEIIPYSDIVPIYALLDSLSTKDRFYQIPFLITLLTLSR